MPQGISTPAGTSWASTRTGQDVRNSVKTRHGEIDATYPAMLFAMVDFIHPQSIRKGRATTIRVSYLQSAFSCALRVHLKRTQV